MSERIGEAAANEMAGYLAAVASAAPTPGGGSVAAVVGALGAALGEMVCTLSIGRQGVVDPTDELTRSLTALAGKHRDLLALAGEDELAYAAFRAASELPRVTPDEKALRRSTMQEALLGAAEVPLRTAATANGLFSDLETVTRFGNPHVLSDAIVAAILAEAAVRSAAVNVRVNTGLLKDRTRAEELDSRVAEIEAAAREGEAAVRRIAAGRTTS